MSAESQSRDAERARIRGATMDLVLEHGYEMVTVEAVCDRAGLDRAAFDRHFGRLEQVCLEVMNTHFDMFSEIVWSSYHAHDSWREGLRACAYASTRFTEEHQRETRFSVAQMLRAGPMAQVARDKQLKDLVDLFDAGRQEMEDPESLDRSVAEGVLGAIYMRLVVELHDPEFRSLVEFLPELMYAAVEPYLGEEAAREELERGPEDLARYRRGEI